MKIIDLAQNSDAWLDWRKSGLGSSDAPALVGLSPWKTRRGLWEEKVIAYHGAKVPMSGAQLNAIRARIAESEKKNPSAKDRGKRLESVARQKHEALYGWDAPDTCGTHDEYEFLKVSLDGWNPERSTFLEIKAPNRDDHEAALAGHVPEKYVFQLVHQFLVSGAKFCHYVSYHDRRPAGEDFTTVRVRRSDVQEAIDLLLVRSIELWESVKQAEYVSIQHLKTGEWI